MGETKDTIIRHIIKAFGYSFAGMKSAWKNELAFRLQAIVIIIVLPLGMWLGKNAVERALLIGSCSLILIVELLNSAVEAVVDRIGQERHDLSKRAKDLGSAASFVTMITAAAVWGLIAYERFF
jgi:diacylglycerol kinase (ATP)